jgi:tetratricopeptide (TPR) repeat protein
MSGLIALRRCATAYLLLASIFCFSVGNARAQDAAAACAPTIGRLVSVQGNVDVQRAGNQDWVRVKRLDTSVCTGDRVRTAPLSRAALFVQPETIVRVDQNTTIALSQTTAEVVVEFFQEDVIRAARDSQSCGAGYFITRFPKKLRVTTPHMNAAVEGTEFEVDVRCASTELAVIEGAVRSQNLATNEEFLVNGGQMVVAGPSSGAVTTLIKPTDAVQWVLYYPPLAETRDEFELPTAEQCRNMASPADGSCLTQRAETLLGLGRSDEALQDVDEALRRDPGNGEASGLRAVVQVARNDKGAALQAANTATTSAPDNYRSWLSLSYAQQAAFDLDGALDSIKKAQSLAPGNSLLNARDAELLLSLGRTREAEAAARAVVQSNPNESRAHTMLGFVHLAQIDTTAARSEFETAIAQDSFDALPRLGLGLSTIRDGELVAGREQLEIAVALDPSNSLLRSYAGKAYYEENSKDRDALAADQFGLAKQLDPNDPTPWFYEAIMQQAQNKPVEALAGLHTSVLKNNNRAVYRSNLLVDDDAAARTASVAAMYANLGFEKLAILESTKAIAENPANHSAHELLATAYSNLPRHDIARVSEALQAQIRQPLAVMPQPLLLSTENLAILRNVGPTHAGTNEYNVLFSRDGARVEFDAIAGSEDTFGDQFLFGMMADDLSIGLSQLHYETDGFIENDAVDKDIYDFFVQKQVTSNSSIQFDAKRSDFEIGETFFRFDPDFNLPVTISEEGKFYRLSGHHDLGSTGDWIWTAVHEDRFREVQFIGDLEPFNNTDSYASAGEIQYVNMWNAIQTVLGVGYVQDRRDFELEQVLVEAEAANVYAYGLWRSPADTLSIEAGLTADWYHREHSDVVDSVERERLNPKVGVTWKPRAGSTLRLAALSSVRRPFIGSQTIEPTQVAGFNQFFSGFERLYGDVEGTISERVGLAFDQAFSQTTFAGLEIAKRELEVPSNDLNRDFTWRESTGFAYLYKTLSGTRGSLNHWRAAGALEAEYEKIERPQIQPGSEGIVDLETIRVPIGVRLFHDSGLSFRVSTTYVEQSGTFSVDITLPTFEQDDSAWITDAALDYRLPGRLGIISAGVLNIGDEFIDLLETDPLNPRVATKRFGFVRLRITF